MVAAMVSDIDKINMVQRMLGGRSDFDNICYQHVRMLANHCRLRNHSGGRDTICSRLLTFWEHRDTLEKLRTDTETYEWFTRKDRPPAESDKLGIYQFMPVDQVQVIEPTYRH